MIREHARRLGECAKTDNAERQKRFKEIPSRIQHYSALVLYFKTFGGTPCVSRRVCFTPPIFSAELPVDSFFPSL